MKKLLAIALGLGLLGCVVVVTPNQAQAGACACVNSLMGCPVVYPNGYAGRYLEVKRGLTDAVIKQSYVYNRTSQYDGGAAYDPTSGWFCVK
jgi:hypothetical protein